MPQFYGQPYPWAPPFAANQIGANATMQQEENQGGWGIPVRQFELAYEFNSVAYAPTEPVWEREVLIEFEITGLRSAIIEITVTSLVAISVRMLTSVLVSSNVLA